MKKALCCLLAFVIVQYTQAQSPTITSSTSISGSVKSLVTITGKNFNSPTAICNGGVPAIAISSAGTSLMAMVMLSAATGTLSVTTDNAVATSVGSFIMLPNLIINTHQGNKLVCIVNTGAALQGYSTAISADGNAAIVGGIDDNTIELLSRRRVQVVLDYLIIMGVSQDRFVLDYFGIVKPIASNTSI